jgi:MFS family permease
MGMQITVMFCVGFFVPITQLYLIDQGVKEENAGYWYSSETASYMVASILLSRISKSWNKPKQMMVGNVVMVVAFLFLGPSPLIFKKSLTLNFIGLLLIGIACGLIYIPSMPHMIEIAQTDYGYGTDDRLNDVIAGITNISLCLGEFFGPLAASALYEPLGFGAATSIISLLILLFGLTYLRHSNFKSKLIKPQVADSELILM